MGRTSSVVVALALVVVVCAGAFGKVDAALRVYNGIEIKPNITVTAPGCCSSCVPTATTVCITLCVTCRVVIQSKTAVTLGPRVGPYPLTSLQVQVPSGTGSCYCVPESDLEYLTATARLWVGSGTACGAASPKGIPGVIFDGSIWVDTCLQLCGSTCSSGNVYLVPNSTATIP